MAEKTERITILATAEFKEFLMAEAENERISVSELVRRRCEQKLANDAEAALFAELVEALNNSVDEAEANLDRSLAVANEVLTELREKREALQSQAER